MIIDKPMTLFEPTEEDMYQYAISRPLHQKVSQAIAVLREYEPRALQLSTDGFYVAFSGGKDSIVMLDLIRKSGVKHKAYYNNTTIDPPELVKFIRTKYREVVWNNPQSGLIQQVFEKNKGLPTHKQRWCCEIYKEQGGNRIFKAIGVRAPESPRRKGLWRVINNHKTNHSPIICPIVYWTDSDVWEYIKKEELEYCELYDQGFKRLGCVGCPMGNQKKDFARWPRYEKAWRSAAEKYYNRTHGTPTKNGDVRWIDRFDTFEEYWEWWIRDEKKTDDPDCQLWLW